MKAKRYTTEEKIRMLRQADKGKTILEVCRGNNLSEQTFHRWKREFGMIDVNQAKRMLAAKLLGIEILQKALEKKWKMPLALGSKPWAQAASSRETCGSRPVFNARSVPILSPAPLNLCVSGEVSGCLANETESGSKAVITAMREGGAIRRSRSC